MELEVAVPHLSPARRYWANRQEHHEEGDRRAQDLPEPGDRHEPARRARQVSVALAELAGEVREGLLALAVGTGLQVMAAIMEADVTARVRAEGPPRPGADRGAARHGAGSVTLGGRRVPVAAAADARGRRLGRACGCREPGHLMRPARIRG